MSHNTNNLIMIQEHSNRLTFFCRDEFGTKKYTEKQYTNYFYIKKSMKNEMFSLIINNIQTIKDNIFGIDINTITPQFIHENLLITEGFNSIYGNELIRITVTNNQLWFIMRKEILLPNNFETYEINVKC